MRSAPEDLTAKIRDAATALLAERGFDAVTIRDVAATAGVSPSLVVHHFGTKAGLRDAADGRVVALVTEMLTQAVAAAGDGSPGATAQMLTAVLREEDVLIRYLRRMFIEGGPSAKALFEQLRAGTEAELAAMVEAGLARPSPNPRWRAAILLVNDLAGIMLDDLITAVFGESPLVEPGLRHWVEVLMQIYTEGLFVASPATAPHPEGPPPRKE